MHSLPTCRALCVPSRSSKYPTFLPQMGIAQVKDFFIYLCTLCLRAALYALYPGVRSTQHFSRKWAWLRLKTLLYIYALFAYVPRFMRGIQEFEVLNTSPANGHSSG